MKHLVLSLCLALPFATPCNAADIPLKQITLDTFMQNNVHGSITVPVLVPSAFEPADLPNANPGYAYWLKPDDVAAVNASGDLPGQSGYMYGKITTNVGYEAQRDLFIGLEEPESLAKAKSRMPGLVVERYRYGRYAIALTTFASPDKKHFTYAMYVATNIDTNVVYIALRPPGDSAEAGEQIWKRLKATLEKSPQN